MQLEGSRVYHDPLHGGIALYGSDPTERLLINLIDTPEFQRLRRIRQLGPASLTFHGAEGSRFTHSLGVMAVARRAFDALARYYPELLPHRATVLCAALLHDIGHGPYSHTAEDIFGGHHEDWTARILRESNILSPLLQALDPELPEKIIATYRQQHPLPLVSQLISSQLDCDRLDYLMRDSYHTGASYGNLDLERILGVLRYDPKRQEVVIAAKGQAAIEHYLLMRSLMYEQVYNHPKNIAVVWGLKQAFRRARALGPSQIPADKTMAAWLSRSETQPDDFALDDYLAADDTIFNYHLQTWQHHSDLLLADLCRRFVVRDLLKAREISGLSSRIQAEVLEAVRDRLQVLDFAPSYYAGLEIAFSRGYQPYRQGIRVETAQGPREIGELSQRVRALIRTQQKTWLVYPAILESELDGIIQQYALPDLGNEELHRAKGIDVG